MPNMWIYRDLSQVLEKNHSLIQILIGPRQCGKSALFLKLSPSFVEISMDDLSLRKIVSEDPLIYLDQFRNKKLLIDEAQLSPEIFSALKRRVDLIKRQSPPKKETLYRLTGSNQIFLDKNVKESLTGRASYFELNTLSVAEIKKHLDLPMGDIIFKGGWPELYTDSDIEIGRYLDDYIRTYIERDIILTAGVQKQREFMHFSQLLAGRTGQLLNYSELSKEVGVNSETIRDWISILERMRFIILIRPYYSNLSNRLIKSPKIYFLDTGITCRLQGHSSVSPLLTSPQMGAIFETLVAAEIYKTMKNFDKNWRIYHWRSRDGEEVDFYIELEDGKSLFLEVKLSRQSISKNPNYPEIVKVFKKKVPPCYLCHLDGDEIVDNAIPIKFLRDFLLTY
ncbi:MAG: ATP-binding protein [Bacteriovoracaceae bacterium]